MSDRNEQIAMMLAAGVPARDLAFEIAVLARIEQRRFVRAMARNIAVAAAATLLLALVMPRLNLDLTGWGSALTGLTGNSMVMMALLVAAFVAWRLRPGAET